MIQEIGKSRFHNEYKNAVPKPESIVLAYRDRELLVKESGKGLAFLSYREAEELLAAKASNGKPADSRLPGSKLSDDNAFVFSGFAFSPVYLFAIDETEYFWLPELASLDLTGCPVRGDVGAAENTRQNLAETGKKSEAADTEAEAGAADAEESLSWRPIDSLRAACPREIAFAGVTGYQLASWYLSRRFCPRCGHAMMHDEQERMMRCPECGLQEYPKISPAVIVAVTDGDRLLLTRYAGRSYKKYALVAGFAEIGETIEETVAREVMEETGLRVKNLRYYKSQPWSFTGTLLMGFFAELDGPDKITLDASELAEAVWCPRAEVPADDGVSLTREMMRVFAHQQ